MNSDVLADVLAGRYKPHPLEDAADWKKYWRSRKLPAQGIKRAFIAGAESCKPAWAMAGGYQLAVQTLLPEVVSDRTVVALCISETGGGHPRAIEASVSWKGKRGLLNGFKTFVTGGELAEHLYIAVNTGEGKQGKPSLVLMKVPLSRRGVSLQTMFPLPFIPELPHASVVLEDVIVSVDDILPGDAYESYIRPFRTVEDLYIMTGMLGHVMGRLAEYDQQDLEEQGIALFLALEAVEKQGYHSPSAHVALAGCVTLLERLIADVLPVISPEQAAIWERDMPVLQVAGNVREQRRRRAWYKVQAPRLTGNKGTQGVLFN